MPYNYMLNEHTRQSTGVVTKDSVIVFDEAHNIEKIAEDGCSFEVSLFKFRRYNTYFKELRKYVNVTDDMLDILNLEDLMMNFEKVLGDLKKALEKKLRDKNIAERKAHQKLTEWKDVYEIFEGKEIFQICKEKIKSEFSVFSSNADFVTLLRLKSQ